MVTTENDYIFIGVTIISLTIFLSCVLVTAMFYLIFNSLKYSYTVYTYIPQYSNAANDAIVI